MGTDRRKQIIDAIQAAIEEETCVGKKQWGSLKEEVDTFELIDGGNKVWCSFGESCKVGEKNPSKKLVYISEAENIGGEVLEISLPYKLSTRYNSQVYETDELIEVRMYGKFRFKKRNYKSEIFMDYLKDNGYGNEVRIDDDYKEYVRLFNISKDLKFDLENIKKRFNKWLGVINDYKEYNFLLQG
ncbi:hypothetical protein [uncultured Clostridium sp.]|jgi:hypothetical protein|uniref:hypothetical protein n=1 Tax=uncultured Clostridium sp. TaxID=59620 RepID=UPI0026155B94|nr:hypothetical protein [uncultured Clostridium sp.]